MMTKPKLLKLRGLEGLREPIIAINLTGGMWEGAKMSFGYLFSFPYWITKIY